MRPEHLRQTLTLCRRCAETRELMTGEYAMSAPGAETSWFLGTLTPLSTGECGRPRIAFHRDRHQRSQARRSAA
jgi:hypothetical protein